MKTITQIRCLSCGETKSIKCFKTGTMWLNTECDSCRRADSKYQRRRAKIEKNGGSHSKKEWLALVEKYDHRCIYPGCDSREVTKDHVIPLDLGGKNSIDNLQPLCRTHNSKKHTQHADYRPLWGTQNP